MRRGASVLVFLVFQLISSGAFASDGMPCTDGSQSSLKTPNIEAIVGVLDDSWFRSNLLPNSDNYGHNYGLDVRVRDNRADGNHLTFNYSSDLYTNPSSVQDLPNGQMAVQQDFTNDNVYSVSYDDAQEDFGAGSARQRHFYYNAVAGVQVLESDPSKNPLNASTQQVWFHEITNRTRQITDVPDGRGTRAGGIAGGDVGVQAERDFSNGFALQGRVDGGGVASGVPGASYARANAQAALRYQYGDFGVRVALDLDDKFYSGGTEKDRGVEVSLLMGKSFEVAGEYEKYGGKPDNYEVYNLPNQWTGAYDPTFEIWIRKSFGGSED